MDWQSLSQISLAEAYARFGTSSTGLTTEQASHLLQTHGPNVTFTDLPTWPKLLARQFTSPFTWLLAAAALVSFAVDSPTDAIIIVAFILLNAGLGFYQEFKSQTTLDSLRHYLAHHVHVLRDGTVVKLPAPNLVPGDVLHLEPGDILPADVRLIEASDLLIDESSLTGESEATPKTSASPQGKAIDIYSAKNMCFSGTTVLRGTARALVIATGRDTNLGTIVRTAAQSPSSGVLEKEVSRFSTFILKMVVITLSVVFLVHLLVKQAPDPLQILVFSLALAVSVVPEALPAVITFSLTRGAAKLAKNHVVVKKLSAIEDLGSLDVLATDKTGTLTENQLQVAQVFSEDQPQTLFLAACASDPLEPFTKAVLDSMDNKSKILAGKVTPLACLPFDPQRRRLTYVASIGAKHLLVTRGAADSILDQCTASSRQPALDWAAAQGTMGRRVLAVASTAFSGPVTSLVKTDAKAKYTLTGLIAFTDPLKPTSLPAVKLAQKLGVSIKMITGDSPHVAGWIGHQIGLASDPSQVITGTVFANLSPADQLQAVKTYSVFARVDPLQKNLIVTTLKSSHSVGFLGEGINDTVALKSADVGIVVAHGSDAARDAANIVLLKKDLKVIIEGIKEGRIIAQNTNKYVTATLASNFGNFYALAAASLVVTFLPMLPIQILLLNLLSDFPMIAIAADSVPSAEIASPQKFSPRSIVALATVLGLVSTAFDFIFFGIFKNSPASVLQTNWFMGSVLTELILLFSIRTRGWFFASVAPSGPLLLLTGVAALATLYLPFSALGARVFAFQPPSAVHVGIILGVVALYFTATELAKHFYFTHSPASAKL